MPCFLGPNYISPGELGPSNTGTSPLYLLAFWQALAPLREGNHAQRPNRPRVPCLPFCACQRSSGAALSERKGTSQAWKTRGLSARLLCSGLGYELQRQTDFLPCLAWAPSQTHGKGTELLGKQWKPS